MQACGHRTNSCQLQKYNLRAVSYEGATTGRASVTCGKYIVAVCLDCVHFLPTPSRAYGQTGTPLLARCPAQTQGEVLPIVLSQVSTRSGHSVIGNFVRRSPKAWPPWA